MGTKCGANLAKTVFPSFGEANKAGRRNTKWYVLITTRITKTVTFLARSKKGIREKIIAYPMIIGGDARTIQEGVLTKK